MVYLDHFGLREAPCSLTPDTDYWYGLASHQSALNMLLLSLRAGEGFIKVVGEVGTGKTLLLRVLLNRLDPEQFVSAWIPNPDLTPAALRSALAEELGVNCPRNLGQRKATERINAALLEHAGAGRHVVLLIDEAQAMAPATLEALRLLTNLETEKRKLLQIVLFGQPELDSVLAQPRIRQLAQRISFSAHLEAAGNNEIAAYLNHRMAIAGAGRPLFSAPAARLLAESAGGVLRIVHILAHKALMAAYGEGAHSVQPAHVLAAIEDTEQARPVRSPVINATSGWPWAALAALGASLYAGGVA